MADKTLEQALAELNKKSVRFTYTPEKKDTWADWVCWLFIFPFEYFTRGYVLSHLWNWFLSPVGFHVITWAQAVGISFAIAAFGFSFVAYRMDVNAEAKKPSSIFNINKRALTYSIGLWLTFGVSWLFAYFFVW